MRKELIGILLFFLVIFTLFSLFSFDPKDAFFHHPGVNSTIHNFFGYAGATVAGHLISLFGLGSYWIPIFLLISSIHFFNARPGTTIAVTITGGMILAITTGGLVSFRDHYILIWGNGFPSGGQIGLSFHRYSDRLHQYLRITGNPFSAVDHRTDPDNRIFSGRVCKTFLDGCPVCVLQKTR